MYIVVGSQNGKSYYLAKRRIGGGFSTIATFQNEGMAKETCDLLNTDTRFDDKKRSKRAALREVK